MDILSSFTPSVLLINDLLKISSSRSSSFTLVGDVEPFTTCVPAHAFPTKYPPNFTPESDPFPCRFGKFSSFQKPNWDRTRHRKLPSQGAPDVDSITEAFSKLRISHGPSANQSVPVQTSIWGLPAPKKSTGCDIAAPYTVRPLSAPLSSLIRNPFCHTRLQPCGLFRPSESTPELSISRHLSTPLSSSDATTGQTYQTSSALSLLTTTASTLPQLPLFDHIASLSGSNTGLETNRTGPRKKSGLPKRNPKSRPIKHRQQMTNSSVSGKPELPSFQHVADARISYTGIEVDIPPSSISSCSSSESYSPPTPVHPLSEDFFNPLADPSCRIELPFNADVPLSLALVGDGSSVLNAPSNSTTCLLSNPSAGCTFDLSGSNLFSSLNFLPELVASTTLSNTNDFFSLFP